MARYVLTNGDRITTFFEWDGVSPNPYPGTTPRKVHDAVSAEWVGKSYDEAVKAGNDRAKADELHPDKNAAEGKRAEALAAPSGGLHASGEALNSQMGDATMALEHPLDPVIGSEMRTPQPALHIAVVPSTQPKTEAQARKDAGEPARFETAADRASAKTLEQETQSSHVRPRRSGTMEPPDANTVVGQKATERPADNASDARKKAAGNK